MELAAASIGNPAIIEETTNDNICEVLRILGAKWAFLVIAELCKGPRRFNQLQRDTAIIKTQSLTDTLRHLERTGIVQRKVFPTVPVTVEYTLTDKGMDFRLALRAMDQWARKWVPAQETEDEEEASSSKTQKS